MYGLVTKSHNYGTIISTQEVAGGIVGSSYFDSTISYCSNEGDVTGGTYFTGGIAGNNEKNSIILSCYNKGIIQGTTYCVGGISGTNYTSEIVNCYNKGIVISKGKDSYEHSQIGGIVGGNSVNATVENCYNTASVTSDYAYIGGIVGYNGNSAAGTQIVKNVYNTGTVKMSTSNPSSDIGVASDYIGYLIGRYGSLSGNYGNTTQEIMSTWDSTTITSNLSAEFTNDVKNEDGTWKYNEGLPILKWQLKQ